MATDFKITITCPTCKGTSMRPTWKGLTDEEGDFLPPVDQPCTDCESGRRVVGVVEIPQLDAIAGVCEDMDNKLDDIIEKINE